MNAKHLLLVGAALLLAVSPAALQAQDDDDDGHIFTVTTLSWPFNNLDDLFEIMEENQELTEQNEFILSRKVLRHQWGGAFSVLIISEYATFDDVVKAQTRGTELVEAKYPREKDRDARDKKFAALAGGRMHKDNIMLEITKLTK